jgi:hypothetical protein
MFASKVRSLPEKSPFQALYTSPGSWPYLQTLDKAGKTCQGHTHTHTNLLQTLIN